MKTLKTNSTRWIALGTLGAMTIGSTAAMTTPAEASSSTWKKIAIGAAAVTGYGLLTHKNTVAEIGAVATVGSYLKYRQDKKKENNQSRYYRYRRTR